MLAVQFTVGKSRLCTYTMFAMLPLHKAWQIMVGKWKNSGKIIEWLKQYLLQNYLQHH